MQPIEIRTFSTQPATVEGRKLSGIAIPYNSNSLDLGGFVERFLPGSVSDTIKSNQIELWAHHDRSKPIGSQASGTLKLFDRDDGLHYENELPENNTDASNIVSLLSAKIIGGTSFGFRVAAGDGSNQRWLREGATNVREIIKADIEHISPVVTPAYPATTALLRSLTAGEIEAVEQYGIDVMGLAKIFIARNKGLEITTEEMELAKKAMELLRTTIQKPRLEKALNRAAEILI